MMKIDEVEWYIKPSATGTYVKQPQPTDYEIEVEDLDANSYRSVTTGNLISNIVSKNWSKCKFSFTNLSQEQAHEMLAKVSTLPIYAKIENPVFPNGFVEAQFRCSKKTIKKMLTVSRAYTLSLNLVQITKVSGM